MRLPSEANLPEVDCGLLLFVEWVRCRLLPVVRRRRWLWRQHLNCRHRTSLSRHHHHHHHQQQQQQLQQLQQHRLSWRRHHESSCCSDVAPRRTKSVSFHEFRRRHRHPATSSSDRHAGTRRTTTKLQRKHFHATTSLSPAGRTTAGPYLTPIRPCSGKMWNPHTNFLILMYNSLPRIQRYNSTLFCCWFRYSFLNSQARKSRAIVRHSLACWSLLCVGRTCWTCLYPLLCDIVSK